MSKFKRRPFMAGHTDVFVMSQPYLTGTEHINSDGLLDSIEALTSGVTQFELSFETEEGSGNFQLDVAVTTEADRTLAAIVEALNTAFGASSVSSLIEASDFEGCLRIQSLGSGLVDTPPLDGIADTLSYIKILPNDSGSSFVDGADLFGFPSFPHPTAVATAGDLAHSPVRPLIQVNRPGVAFLARGEDRVSQNFNRALHQLSINEDSLNTRLKARVPVPTVLDIERGSTRLQKDASNRIVGLLLTGTHSDALDSILGAESRVFIGGGLSGTSTLLDIADFFSVQDQEDNQIQADQRVVRVGAVTSGYSGSVTVPTFVSESGAPTSSVPDSTVPLDNGNLLGLQYEKTAATVISSVTDGCVLVCDSATFSTDGVIKGDLVTIAGSSITAPISHNGTYYVETVISETELEVRPVDHDNVLILNESESGGLGSATVTTDGNFAQNVVLMFSPPIADFPPDRVAEDGTTPITGVLRIVLGLEAPLGEVPSEFLARSTVKTAAEVDAFVTRRVWRRMSFDGLYQGQSYDFRGSQQGGGAEGRITHGPISLSVASNRDRPASLTAEMTGTGSLEMRGDDLVLTADPTFVFSDTDIGKVVFVSDTGGTLFADETPFTLSEFLSYREIRLTPPVDYRDWRTADLVGTTSCSFEVVSEGQAAIQAAMMFVANDKTAAGTAAAKAGLVFVRNHRDGADGDVSPGTSLLHLERIRNVKTRNAGVNSDADAHFLSASTTAAARTITLTGTTSSDVVHLKDNTHLFWSENATVKSSNGIGCTLLRIVNGPNAGFYEVHELSVDTGVFTVQPIENAFDGATTWAGFISTAVTQVANLYNVVFSVGGKRTAQDPVLGAVEVTSGVTAFADAADKVAEGTYTPSAGVARAIQAHWIGEGSALHVRVNDPDFYSISSVSASTGYAIDVRVYNPAQGGYVRAHANFTSGGAAYRVARALRLHTDSSTVDRKRELVPSDVLTEASGSSLEATSRYADPAIKVMAGTAEDPQHTKLFPGGPFPDTSSSALVIMDNRYADLTGEATDTSTDQINVPQGLRIGALTVTGATTINRESPVLSMSPILSSAMAPLFALRSSVGFPASILDGLTEFPTWTTSATYTLFENSISHNTFGTWPGKSAHLMPGWSDRYYAHTASASLGFPEVDLDYPTAGSALGTITLSSLDYSLFQTKHEYVLSLPEGQTLFQGPSVFAEHLPGRVLWVSLDDGTGGGEATHSFLFRVEAMVVSSGIRLALYAQDEVGRRPDLTQWTVVSCGLKAARWSHAYIDIADSMMIGSAYQADGLSPGPSLPRDQASFHSPVLTLLRTSPYAPQMAYIGSDWYDIEKDAAGLSSIKYTGGATVTVTAANLGLLSDNVVSLAPSGFVKFSFFEDMDPNPTGQALWLLNHAIPGFSQESSPFGQFFLGGGATWSQYPDSIVSTPQWNVYTPEIDLLGAEADRKIFRNGYFFESIALPGSDRSRIATALAGTLWDSSHIVRWSPHRGGSLSLTQSRAGQFPGVNELSGTRIWMPVGRSFSSEYLNLRVSVAGSHILESIYGADMATPWATHTGFLIAIRRADGTAIATKEMTLEVAAGSTGDLLEKAFSNSQDIQTGLAFSDFGDTGLGGQSPTFREDGSLNKGRAETSEPLFVTIDFYTLRLSETESLDSIKAAELYATLPELGGGTSPVIPLPYEEIGGNDANNGRLILSALQVTDVRPPAYLTGSAAVGGTVTARNFRYRDAVTKYLSSGPEKVQFHTGLRYSNVASSHTFSTAPPADNYYTSGMAALSPGQTGNMSLGKSAFDGLGPITGMFQPLYGSAGGFRSTERIGYLTDSALDTAISNEGLGDNAHTLGTGNDQDSVRLVNELTGTGVLGSVNSKTAVASAPAGLRTPQGMSGVAVPDSALNLTYTAQSQPWVQVTHDQSVQFHRGVSGASIVGHHSNDPLWYQCEALSRKRGSVSQYLVRGVSDGYTSTARDAEFLFHRNGVVMPGPTGFVVPIEAPDGTLLTEFSWHVSITPRVWSQTTDIYEYSNEKPGTYADGSLDPLPDHVNTPEKQADWGIYHSCPQSADGVTSPPPFPMPESCLSHAVGAWEAKAGFAVDIYRLKIGSSSNPEDWTNFDHLEEHSMAERVHTSTVSLSSLDKQPHEVVDQHYPAATGHSRSTGVIFRWSETHFAVPGAVGHPRYTPPNECHIKGTEDVSIEIDRSQYTYFAVIRAFVTGDRLFTSLAHLGSSEVASATGFADSAGSLYWYSHCGPGQQFQKSAGDLPGVWASGWSELSESLSQIDSSLVPLWVNSQNGVSSMGKSATCRVGTNPFGVPAFSSDDPFVPGLGFGLREHFTPPVFTFRASRSAYKTDKP